MRIRQLKMSIIISSALFSALLLVTNTAQLQSGEGMDDDQAHYIIASSSSSCPIRQCLTLSKFARNTSLYLVKSTVLIFKDEIHTLDSRLLINGIHSFSASAERNIMNSTIIVCTKSFAFKKFK